MTKILCYDIHYKNGVKGPSEVQIWVSLPANWLFDYTPAKITVKKVLEVEVKLEVDQFEWRPI